MSHHLDSPEARQDPRLDISDVYLFRGGGGTVFVINANPVSGKDGFHPEGLYEFRVDTDGDVVEDITFRVRFGDRDSEERQAVELSRLDGAAARDRDAQGEVLASGRTEEELGGTGGVRLWAGPAADPFYMEGNVLGAVRKAVTEGEPLDLGGWEPSQAENLFTGTNVWTIVLEVPDSVLGVDSIGFWATTALPTDAGGWRQINRCAQPLMNTLFTPDESDQASEYNRTHPSEDRKTYGPAVRQLVSRVAAVMRSTDDADDHAEQVCDILFPDVLRYAVGSKANFGFARRNGRGLTEPTPEVMFSIVLNKAVPLGLDASSAGVSTRAEFPYLPLPLAAS